MSFIKKIWEKTVFSDMVANSKKRKEEDSMIKAEAIAEAEEEIKTLKKEIIKEQYKEQELSRIKKSQKSFAEKLSDGFGGSNAIGNLASDDKIRGMIGSGNNNEFGNTSDSLNSDRKINMILGRPLDTNKSHLMSEDLDKSDKIKDYISDSTDKSDKIREMLFDDKDRSDKIKRMVK